MASTEGGGEGGEKRTKTEEEEEGEEGEEEPLDPLGRTDEKEGFDEIHKTDRLQLICNTIFAGFIAFSTLDFVHQWRIPHRPVHFPITPSLCWMKEENSTRNSLLLLILCHPRGNRWFQKRRKGRGVRGMDPE